MSCNSDRVAAPTPPYVSLRERLWKAGDVVKAIDRWRESLPIDAFSPEDSLRLLRALASLPTVAAPTPETPSLIECPDDLPWELCSACLKKLAAPADLLERCTEHPAATHELVCSVCLADGEKVPFVTLRKADLLRFHMTLVAESASAHLAVQHESMARIGAAWEPIRRQVKGSCYNTTIPKEKIDD